MFAGLSVAWDFGDNAMPVAVDDGREARVAQRRRALQSKIQAATVAASPSPRPPPSAPTAPAAPQPPAPPPPPRKPLTATRLVPSPAVPAVRQRRASEPPHVSPGCRPAAEGSDGEGSGGGGVGDVGVSRAAEQLWRYGFAAPHLWSSDSASASATASASPPSEDEDEDEEHGHAAQAQAQAQARAVDGARYSPPRLAASHSAMTIARDNRLSALPPGMDEADALALSPRPSDRSPSRPATRYSRSSSDDGSDGSKCGGSPGGGGWAGEDTEAPLHGSPAVAPPGPAAAAGAGGDNDGVVNEIPPPTSPAPPRGRHLDPRRNGITSTAGVPAVAAAGVLPEPSFEAEPEPYFEEEFVWEVDCRGSAARAGAPLDSDPFTFAGVRFKMTFAPAAAGLGPSPAHEAAAAAASASEPAGPRGGRRQWPRGPRVVRGELCYSPPAQQQHSQQHNLLAACDVAASTSTASSSSTTTASSRSRSSGDGAGGQGRVQAAALGAAPRGYSFLLSLALPRPITQGQGSQGPPEQAPAPLAVVHCEFRVRALLRPTFARAAGDLAFYAAAAPAPALTLASGPDETNAAVAGGAYGGFACFMGPELLGYLEGGRLALAVLLRARQRGGRLVGLHCADTVGATTTAGGGASATRGAVSVPQHGQASPVPSPQRPIRRVVEAPWQGQGQGQDLGQGEWGALLPPLEALYRQEAWQSQAQGQGQGQGQGVGDREALLPPLEVLYRRHPNDDKEERWVGSNPRAYFLDDRGLAAVAKTDGGAGVKTDAPGAGAGAGAAPRLGGRRRLLPAPAPATAPAPAPSAAAATVRGGDVTQRPLVEAPATATAISPRRRHQLAPPRLPIAVQAMSQTSQPE